MPLTNYTITRRHVRVNVNARDSIRTGDDDLGRTEGVGRAHPHFPTRDRAARTEDGRSETGSDENRPPRNSYRHVPSISPSSNTRSDRHSPRQTESTFHSTPSRQPLSREQSDQRRQSSYRLEQYIETIVYTNSDQSDQSGQSSYRLERYENIVYTTSRQPPPEEPSDQSTHFSHRTEWAGDNTSTNSPRQAPPREPTHQTRNFSRRTEWSDNTSTNSPRQAAPREPTLQTRSFSHRSRRSDHTSPHHSPRQALPPSRRERPHQSEYSFSPYTSTSSTSSTPPPVAPGGGDLYRILKVSPEASHDEIVSAARRRRIEVHPDRLQYPGMTQSALDAIDDEARNVGLAADTLCDEASRRWYDRAVRRGSRS